MACRPFSCARVLLALSSLSLLPCAAGCSEEAFPQDAELQLLKDLQVRSAVPDDSTSAFSDNPAAAALGEKLFKDPLLSSCGTVACVSCHPGGTAVSGRKLDVGCGGEMSRNTPSLMNVAYRRWLYWDGRKDRLWSHPILPLTRATEMGSSGEKLRGDLQARYAADYQAVFGRPPQDEPDGNRLLANFGKAVGAHLRTVVKTKSPFDTELAAFIKASEADIAAGGGEVEVKKQPNYLGLKTFLRKGHCIACHKGPMLSDDGFHNLGIDEHGKQDLGREDGEQLVRDDLFNGGGAYSDDPATGKVKLDRLDVDVPKEGAKGAFKTASLRGVALSAPYMHTGELESLEAVIDFYDRGGDAEGSFQGKRAETIVPLDLTDEEKRALVDLLTSMNPE